MTINFVQAPQNYTTSSTSSLTVALGTNAVGGNCLVACVGGYLGSSVNGITSSGSPDYWVQAATESHGSILCELWIDPGCHGGNSTVNITTAGNGYLSAQVFEFSGVLASSPVDVTAPGGYVATRNQTSWTSGTSGTASAGDVWLGMMAGVSITTGYSVSGPGSPWGNEAVISGGTSSNYSRLIAGYYVDSSSGTVTYSGTNTNYQAYGALAVALKPAVAPGGGSAGSFLPFF